MNYQIVIQPNAQTDIERAYRWLLERAPTRAVTWYNGLQQAIDSLQSLPERCSLAPEDEYFSEEIRQLLYGRRGGVYRILFTIVDNIVHILHVRHSAQDILREEEDDTSI